MSKSIKEYRRHVFRKLWAIKDLYEYLCSFKQPEDSSLETDGSHPASLVTELLTEGDAHLRCQQLDSWFQEYAKHRECHISTKQWASRLVHLHENLFPFGH